MTLGPEHRPPPLIYLALEARAPLELLLSGLALPWLSRLPRGVPHPVMVLPGYATTDTWTAPLRRLLRHLGYDARGWGQGRNAGLTRVRRARLLEELERLHTQSGERVSLVGWSLGGQIARELARRQPGDVRCVISLGSPFAGDPRATTVSRVRRLLGVEPPVDWAATSRRRSPPPVPTTAVHSRSDAVVNWRCSLEERSPHTESIQVCASHLGLPCNPWVLLVILDRLAQPLGAWHPFVPSRWHWCVRPAPR